MNNLYGNDLFGNAIKPNFKNVISERFIIPPFTILNAREGFWQDRKRAWIGMGIEEEIYRSGIHSYGKSCVIQRNRGKIGFNGTKYLSGKIKAKEQTHASIFDPVLCELMYEWFCPKRGQIIDPFAGGSVRGIVASMLDRHYWGCDLSEGQIHANYEQAEAICPNNIPLWLSGDSLEILENAPDADFIFSCPPYGDLEKYSDDPRDLSNMEYHTFVAKYKRIILQACQKLRNNRFACFVVSNYRDNKGNYRNLVGDTITAFKEQGLHFYNDVILVNAIGSLPIRITKQFEASRKMGKTHQNVLIFVKGDGKKATENIANNT